MSVAFIGSDVRDNIKKKKALLNKLQKYHLCVISHHK